MEYLRLFLITLLITTYTNSTFAQVDDPTGKPVKEFKTLFGSDYKIRGFGAIDVQVTDIQDEIAILTGAHFGAIINNHYILGLGGSGIATNLRFDSQTSEGEKLKVNLRGGYAGLVIGYVLAPKEAIHLSFPVLIGIGNVEEDPTVGYRPAYIEEFDEPWMRSRFVVIEPKAELELNVSNSFKIGLNASYRFIDRLDLLTLNNKELSNFSYGLSFKIGRF